MGSKTINWCDRCGQLDVPLSSFQWVDYQTAGRSAMVCDSCSKALTQMLQHEFKNDGPIVKCRENAQPVT